MEDNKLKKKGLGRMLKIDFEEDIRLIFDDSPKKK